MDHPSASPITSGRNPDDPITHMRLGDDRMAAGRPDLAAMHYLDALAFDIGNAEIHHKLGIAFAAQGKPNEAIECYLTAIALRPEDASPYINLGNALSALKRAEEARNCYLKAIELQPMHPEAHYNLGRLYHFFQRPEEAMACYRKTIECQPDHIAAWNNIGLEYHRLGDADQAIFHYRKALEYKPDYPDAYNNLLLEMQYSMRTAQHSLMSMQYAAGTTPEALFKAHEEFGKQFETPLRSTWPDWEFIRVNPDPDRRLKIGYVSADFREHAVATFMEPVLKHHDRKQVEVFCYYNHTHIDAVTECLQALGDHWIPCKYLSDDELAARIRADGIDILVDLSGHTEGNRLLVFARKPAPLQVTWLGYIATTGLTAIDYRFTNAAADPPGTTEALHTETLWRLPETFFCYRPRDNSPDVIDHPPALDNGFITFGSLNNFSKLNDATLALWGRILERVPESRLMLVMPQIENDTERTALEQRLSRLGLPLDRLVPMPRLGHDQYLANYNRIDIALDPFPFNGGTTSLDTLWMGVPFITLAGDHFSARMGVSILGNIGLQELIAGSEQEYVDIAAAIAGDIPRLERLRMNLRQRLQASPLMDAPRFAHHLEQAYREMWRRWLPQTAYDAREQPVNTEQAILHYNQGVALHQQGKLNEAALCYEQALRAQPDFAEANNNLGLICSARGNHARATEFYRQATRLKSDFLEAHNNLGNALREQGVLDAAIASYFRALAIKVDYPEAHLNLGIAFAEAKQFDKAHECYITALALKPDDASIHYNRGNAWREQGKLQDAMASYRQAIALNPSHAKTYANLGSVYHSLGQPDEAIALCRQAIAIDPDYNDAYQVMLMVMQYASSLTQQDVFEAHLGYARQFEAPLRATWPQHVPDRSARRLRIGYLSPDFRQHPVANFFEPLLAHHDRSRFEVFCYSNLAQGDAVTARLQTLAEHWVPCKLLSDEQLAERIRADGIDVLVDLAGHTAGNRLSVFARKPAPVQVTWLGYVATTGLSAIDYRFTDAIADPSGMTEHLHSETLWRLPESFFCYRPYDECPEPDEQPPALKNGFVTFGCLNNFSKVSDDALRLWAEILQRVPSARLMLAVGDASSDEARAHTDARLARLGLPADRLILLPNQTLTGYLSAYCQIDIALDPFPFNGGTTSLDTLYMGVPFIALAGDHFTARMGAAILSHAGLQELVTDSGEQYVDLAVRLTNDLPRLSAIRFNLRQRLQASPLMDAPRFARHVEGAFTQMLGRTDETLNGQNKT